MYINKQALKDLSKEILRFIACFVSLILLLSLCAVLDVRP